MDLSRLPEANELIRQGVSKAFPSVLCVFSGLTGGSCQIGQDRVLVRLHDVSTKDSYGEPVPSGRHKILVETANSKPVLFRETRAGWFNFERLISTVIELANKEAVTRATKERHGKHLATAKNLANSMAGSHNLKRLADVFLTVGPSTRELGLFQISLDCLTSGQANQVLSYLAGTLSDRTKEQGKNIWSHLQDEDFDAT